MSGEKPARIRKRTERGFAIYGEVRDNRGNVTRVQESSIAAGPYCYLFVHDAEGRGARPDPTSPTGAFAPAPHLTRAQARRLAKALLRFADGAR